MKRFFVNQLVIAALVVAAVFTSCGRDNDGDECVEGETGVVTQIIAKVENAAEYNLIDMVALRAQISLNQREVLAVADFKNGGFTLQLPETVDEKYLRPISDRWGEGITISNTSAKIFSNAYISGYKDDALNRSYNTLECIKEIETSNSVSLYLKEYWYVDSDVNVSGTHTETFQQFITSNSTVSLVLKKGWNVVYIKYIQSDPRSMGFVTEYKTELRNTAICGLKWQIIR